MRPEDFIGADWGKTLTAGALGGMVRWLTLRGNWREGAIALIVGSICALYLGPIVEPLLDPIIGKLAPNGDPRGFASFVVGLGGVSLSGFMLDVLSLSYGWIKARGKRDGD